MHDVAEIPGMEATHAGFVATLPADCTALERMTRDVFPHAAAIVAGGMQPSRCRMCRGQAPLVEHDCGWFGDHSKGVT